MSYIGKHIRKSTPGERPLDAGQNTLPDDVNIDNRALPDEKADIRALSDDDTLDFDFDDAFDADPDPDPDPDDSEPLNPFDWQTLKDLLRWLGTLFFIPLSIAIWLVTFIAEKLFHWKRAREFRELFTLPMPDFHHDRIDLSELSEEKQLILEVFSDEEVRAMLEMMLEHRESDEAQAHDADTDRSGDLHLDAATMAKLENYRARESKLDSREAHWLTSVETLLNCKYQRPQGFDGLTVQQTYRKLYDFLTARFLPEAFIRSVVPELVYYVVNGELRRPLLLVGAPGCGKTTSIKIISEALGMVNCHYDAVTRDASHSLFGEASSFQNPDCGDLVSGIINTGVLNPIFHFDEPDKTSSPTTRSAFQDEALSLCDGSHETFTDIFLGFPLSLKGIIICFTANTTDTISQPLLDRCEVVHFKDIEESRVQDIIAHYAETERQSLLYKGALELDQIALRNAVATLYKRGVHSIRQHQKLVDRAFCGAFNAYVFSDSDHPESVLVGEAMFSEAMASSEFLTAKRAGF